MDKQINIEKRSIKPPVNTSGDPRIESPQIEVVYQDTAKKSSEEFQKPSIPIEPKTIVEESPKKEEKTIDLKQAVKQHLFSFIGAGLLVFVLGYLIGKK